MDQKQKEIVENLLTGPNLRIDDLGSFRFNSNPGNSTGYTYNTQKKENEYSPGSVQHPLPNHQYVHQPQLLSGQHHFQSNIRPRELVRHPNISNMSQFRQHQAIYSQNKLQFIQQQPQVNQNHVQGGQLQPCQTQPTQNKTEPLLSQPQISRQQYSANQCSVIQAKPSFRSLNPSKTNYKPTELILQQPALISQPQTSIHHHQVSQKSTLTEGNQTLNQFSSQLNSHQLPIPSTHQDSKFQVTCKPLQPDFVADHTSNQTPQNQNPICKSFPPISSWLLPQIMNYSSNHNHGWGSRRQQTSLPSTSNPYQPKESQPYRPPTFVPQMKKPSDQKSSLTHTQIHRTVSLAAIMTQPSQQRPPNLASYASERQTNSKSRSSKEMQGFTACGRSDLRTTIHPVKNTLQQLPEVRILQQRERQVQTKPGNNLKSREMIQNRVGLKSAGNVPLNPSSNWRNKVTSIGTQTSWSLEPVESYFFMKNSDSVFAILDPSIAETIRNDPYVDFYMPKEIPLESTSTSSKETEIENPLSSFSSMMGPLLDEGFDDLRFIGSEHTEYDNSDNQLPDPYPSVKNPEPNQEHISHHDPHVDGIDQLAHIPVEEYQEMHVPILCGELKKSSTPESSSSRAIVYGSKVRIVTRNLFQSPVVHDGREQKDECDESFSTESTSDYAAYQESDTSSCNTSSDVSTRPLQKTKDLRLLGQTRKVNITPKDRADIEGKAEGNQWQERMESNVKLVDPKDCNKSVRSKRIKKPTYKARELEENKVGSNLRNLKERKRRREDAPREVQGVKKLKLSEQQVPSEVPNLDLENTGLVVPRQGISLFTALDMINSKGGYRSKINGLMEFGVSKLDEEVVHEDRIGSWKSKLGKDKVKEEWKGSGKSKLGKDGVQEKMIGSGKSKLGGDGLKEEWNGSGGSMLEWMGSGGSRLGVDRVQEELMGYGGFKLGVKEVQEELIESGRSNLGVQDELMVSRGTNLGGDGVQEKWKGSGKSNLGGDGVHEEWKGSGVSKLNEVGVQEEWKGSEVSKLNEVGVQEEWKGSGVSKLNEVGVQEEWMVKEIQQLNNVRFGSPSRDKKRHSDRISRGWKNSTLSKRLSLMFEMVESSKAATHFRSDDTNWKESLYYSEPANFLDISEIGDRLLRNEFGSMVDFKDGFQFIQTNCLNRFGAQHSLTRNAQHLLNIIQTLERKWVEDIALEPMDKIHQDENINTDCKDNQNNHHNPGQNGLMECKKGRNDRSIQKSFPRLTNGAIRKTDKGQRIKLKSRVKKLVETKKVVEHEENPESNMEVTPPPKPVTIIEPVPDIIQCSDEPNSCNGTQSELPGKDDSKLITERSCKVRQTKQKINPVQENVKHRYSLTTCPVCLKKMQRKSVPRHILDVHKVKVQKLSHNSNKSVEKITAFEALNECTTISRSNEQIIEAPKDNKPSLKKVLPETSRSNKQIVELPEDNKPSLKKVLPKTSTHSIKMRDLSKLSKAHEPFDEKVITCNSSPVLNDLSKPKVISDGDNLELPKCVESHGGSGYTTRSAARIRQETYEPLGNITTTFTREMRCPSVKSLNQRNSSALKRTRSNSDSRHGLSLTEPTAHTHEPMNATKCMKGKSESRSKTGSGLGRLGVKVQRMKNTGKEKEPFTKPITKVLTVKRSREVSSQRSSIDVEKSKASLMSKNIQPTGLGAKESEVGSSSISKIMTASNLGQGNRGTASKKMRERSSRPSELLEQSVNKKPRTKITGPRRANEKTELAQNKIPDRSLPPKTQSQRTGNHTKASPKINVEFSNYAASALVISPRFDVSASSSIGALRDSPLVPQHHKLKINASQLLDQSSSTSITSEILEKGSSTKKAPEIPDTGSLTKKAPEIPDTGSLTKKAPDLLDKESHDKKASEILEKGSSTNKAFEIPDTGSLTKKAPEILDKGTFIKKASGILKKGSSTKKAPKIPDTGSLNKKAPDLLDKESHDKIASEILEKGSSTKKAPEILEKGSSTNKASEIPDTESLIKKAPEILEKGSPDKKAPEILDKEFFTEKAPEILDKESFTEKAPEILDKESFTDKAPEILDKESFTDKAPEILDKGSFTDKAPEILDKGTFTEKAQEILDKESFTEKAPEILEQGSLSEKAQEKFSLILEKESSCSAKAPELLADGSSPEKSPDTLKPGSTEKSPDTLKPGSTEKSPDKLKPELTEKSPDTLKPELTEKSPDTLKPGLTEKSPDTLKPGLTEKSPDTLKPGLTEKSYDTLKPGLTEKSPDTLKPGSTEKSQDKLKPELTEKSPDTLKPGLTERSPDTLKPGLTERSPDTLKPGLTERSPDTLKPGLTEKSPDTLKPGLTERSPDTLKPGLTERSPVTLKPGLTERSPDVLYKCSSAEKASGMNEEDPLTVTGEGLHPFITSAGPYSATQVFVEDMMVPEKLKDGCQPMLGPIRLMVDPELDPILSESDI